MMPEPEETKNIADRLMAALQKDQFVLYAQSIVALDPKPGAGTHQEIFIRFAEEDERLLPPGSFFPILEEFRLLPFLDRWVVNRLARWVRSGLGIKPDWQVPHSSVNLSTETLEDPEFGPYVCRYVDDSWLSNGAIGFEIARDTAIDHRDSVQRLIAQVRPYRCHLSLTGFDGDERSMAALRDFKPEFVKINVATIDPARVSEISRACHAAGSRVVAEYVENDRVLDHLRRSKIEFAQGFAISQVQPL